MDKAPQPFKDGFIFHYFNVPGQDYLEDFFIYFFAFYIF